MRYTEDIKKQAFDYYCKGLNSKEIAKLLDLNYRAVQEFMQKEEWKAKRAGIRLKEEKRIVRKYHKIQMQNEFKKAKKEKNRKKNDAEKVIEFFRR